MKYKPGFFFLLMFTTAATFGSGCQSNSLVAQRATQISRQLRLVPTPISSRQMSGSIGKNGSGQMGPHRFGPSPQRLHQMQMPQAAQIQFAKMHQDFMPATPEVKTALSAAQTNAQIIKQLGQKLELLGKYSFRQERFQNGGSTTEFEYGIQGDQGHGIMTGKTVINQGKTTTESLVVRPDSGGTIVLK